MIAENGNGILWTWSKGFFQTFTTDQVLAGMLGGRQSSQRHFTLVSSIIHWFSTKVELVADVNNVYQHSAKLAMINCTIKHFQSHFALSWVLNVVPFRTFIFRFIEPCCGRTESSSSNFFRFENACYRDSPRLWAICRLPEYPEYLIILIKRLMGYLMICLTLTESPWYPWFLVRVPKTGFVNQKSRQSVSKSHAHHKKVKKSLYKPLWSDTPYSQVT